MPAYDPVRNGGTLYVAGDNGQIFALDPATGADRWPPVAVGFVYGNMALAGGLIVVSSGGSLVMLDSAGCASPVASTSPPAAAAATTTGIAVAISPRSP